MYIKSYKRFKAYIPIKNRKSLLNRIFQGNIYLEDAEVRIADSDFVKMLGIKLSE